MAASYQSKQLSNERSYQHRKWIDLILKFNVLKNPIVLLDSTTSEICFTYLRNHISCLSSHYIISNDINNEIIIYFVFIGYYLKYLSEVQRDHRISQLLIISNPCVITSIYVSFEIPINFK